MIPMLLSLALIFGELSVLAFGGGNSILPEMQRQLVEVHRWMTAAQFNALFGLAQAAPGPNMMVVTLLGWRLAGFWGALVATIAKFTPSSLITGFALHAWDRFKNAPWRRAVQTGLVPITVGLVAASAALIAGTAAVSPMHLAVIAVIGVLSATTKIHPLWLLVWGAVFGLSGWGFS